MHCVHPLGVMNVLNAFPSYFHSQFVSHVSMSVPSLPSLAHGSFLGHCLLTGGNSHPFNCCVKHCINVTLQGSENDYKSDKSSVVTKPT